MNNTIINPFEMLFRKLEGMEMTMNELKSKLDKIEDKGVNKKDTSSNDDNTIMRKAAADYLGISVGTIDNLVKSKQLKHIRFGKSVRFMYEDLDDFIESRKVRPS